MATAREADIHTEPEAGPAPDNKAHQPAIDGKAEHAKRVRTIWIWVIIALLCAGGLAGGLAGYFAKKQSSSEPSTPTSTTPGNEVNNQTGIFNTSTVKQSASQSVFTSWIPFSFPFASAPDVILNLQKLDLSKGSSTLGIDTLTSNITARGFTVHVSTTRDTTINEAVLQWMAVPDSIPDWTTDYQSGHFGILSVRDRADTGHTYNVGEVKFKRPYTAPPRVVVWIHAFDFDNDHNWRLHAYPTNIRGVGFTVNVNTWSNTLLYSANISWVAWSQGERAVIGNYWHPNMTRLNATEKLAGWGNTSFISFAQGEKKRMFPELLAGFNEFDVSSGGDMKILVENGVGNEGMVCTVRSFGNVTLGNNFDIAWLAAT